MTSEPAKTRRWRHLRFHGLKSQPSTSPASDAAETVLRQGFLLKKGHRLPTTKERFFMLRPRLLSYFRSAATDARHLRGVIELSPSDLVTSVATSRHWFLLQKPSGPDGKPYQLELRASSPEERQQWIDALRAASRDPGTTAAQTARDAECERQLTRTLTMLRVRDASLLSTVLRQQATGPAPDSLVSKPSAVDLRASFQVFHELLLLQSLVKQIKAEWGEPAAWSLDQYDALVESIALASHQSASGGAAPEEDETSVLCVARGLQYAFEEVPENQQKLVARQRAATAAAEGELPPVVRMSLHGSFVGGPSAAAGGRLRCPTIYSYLSTFERLSPSDTERASSISSSGSTSARSSLTGGVGEDGGQPLSPRSATLAKYAHLYLEEEGRHRKPWSWERIAGDELLETETSIDAGSVTQLLADRFDHDHTYSYVRHHSLLFVNPNRVLKTHKFTSIYDEQVVLAYAQTPFAQTQLAPHPFAMTKQALFRLFFSNAKKLSLVLSGDSGSGKTELAKELLKYTVLTAQSSLPSTSSRKIVLYTSSTKSTFQMRNEEARTLDLLHAKGITDYEVMLLDLTPQKWADMTSVSKSKRLPQVHINGLFFGFYETLQRLEDEEQLRMYFRNPHVAKKLSSVLDSNILLEAFAHASTPLNANSSRYAKSVEIQVAYGRDPSQYQVVGCAIHPFLLEKSRVTSSGQRNFHVFYALVHGLNADFPTGPQNPELAKKLHLSGSSSKSFKYLSGRDARSSDRSQEWKRKKDAERFQNIITAMETVAMDLAQQEAIFRVLSAVLWLGNLDFTEGSSSSELEFVGTSGKTNTPISNVLQELLSLASVDGLRSLLLVRRVEMASTGEAFNVQLSIHQARHSRDTLARFLYEMAFHFVVSHLNQTAQAPSEYQPSVRSLCIVDMFGFENFVGSGNTNSLEQLCINYMTEKFAAAEERLVSSQYSRLTENVPVESRVLQLFEHPLGIFATLEEQTVLHQSEGDSALASEQKKNDLFVIYLYQRNQAQLPPQPSHLKQHTLQFLVPHSRDIVTYEAHDFVKKNSDFQRATLLQNLEKSQSPGIREMVQLLKQQASTASRAGPRSLTTQFRAQIQHQVAQLEDPLFFHCFRPNPTTAWGSASHVDRDTLEKQVQAQRIAQIAQLSYDVSSAFEVSVDANLFQTRYKSLLSSSEQVNSSVDALCKALEVMLRGVLDLSDTDHDGGLFEEKDNGVRVRTLQVAETLELLLGKRRFEAATRLQAFVRMVRAWRWYHALQADRRALTQELLQLYGPDSTRKIERTLRKYQGHESELMAKIVAKKKEKAAIAEITSGMETFMMQTGSGGLDPQLLEEVLRDSEIQRQIAVSKNRIVLALREMSLNPQQVLPKQLADPELRTFYQRMLQLMQQLIDRRHAAQEAIGDAPNPSASLEDRVRLLVLKHKSLWRQMAHGDSHSWAEIQDRLSEIGDEPDMLLFYSDDEEFLTALTGFVEAVESKVIGGGASGDSDDEDSSADVLIGKLKLVEFSPTLMAAMQGDPFFVEALQSPQVVTAVHQLMTDRDAFAVARGGLASPQLKEFFHRLVRLSEETKKHR